MIRYNLERGNKIRMQIRQPNINIRQNKNRMNES